MQNKKTKGTYRLEEGSLVFSGDMDNVRQSLMEQGKNTMFSFAEILGSMESSGFLGNESLVKEKLQALYDQFEMEHGFFATPEDEDGRFDLLQVDAAGNG